MGLIYNISVWNWLHFQVWRLVPTKTETINYAAEFSQKIITYTRDPLEHLVAHVIPARYII